MARRVLCVVGTRPEAVKVAPVVLALRAASWEPIVVTTGQHGSAASEVFGAFGLKVDKALNEWDRDASLVGLHAELVRRLGRVVADVDPDMMLVQGDTASTLAGAMVGFWAEIPVIHLEAGLRSGLLDEPFPEEANRRMVAQIASLHLAPTNAAAAALRSENVAPDSVLVIGNTVVDAVRRLVATASGDEPPSHGQDALVLVTCHRRENWGDGVRQIGEAVRRVVDRSGLRVVVVAHPNPSVRELIDEELSGVPGVSIRDALPYEEFVGLLGRASVVLTDSGGVQEEAAALGVPAVVLRSVTERREGVDAGVARLVGTEPDRIVDGVHAVLSDDVPGGPGWPPCPYGDGRAAQRCVDALKWKFGAGERPDPFAPQCPEAKEVA